MYVDDHAVERGTSALTRSRVLCVWSSSSPNGKRNLARGIESRTWGFKDLQIDYAQQFDWVLFGCVFGDGSPRVTQDVWARSTVTVIIGRVNRPYYRAQSFHWEDELEQNKLIYPHRFGFTVEGLADDVPTRPSGPLGASLTEALRLSAIRNSGIYVPKADLTSLIELTGRGAHIDVSFSLRAEVAPGVAGPRKSRNGGPGRSDDPRLRSAVERHAVDAAKEHMLKLGWREVWEVGKPYDLHCRSGKLEKHVEVKGTTGAGAEVEFTRNEVANFRNPPANCGADLIVVSDIKVDRSDYSTRGGVLRHFENYTAPESDLTPSRFTAVVPSGETPTGSHYPTDRKPW